MTVTVVGRGIVGRRVLRGLQVHAPAGPPVAVSWVDTRSTPLDALEAGDVAVLTLPGPHADLAATLASRSVSLVSVSDAVDDVRDLLDLDDLARAHDAAIVVGAAMAPGLAELIARHLADGLAVCDEVHVAVHATAGPACARQHHRALRGRAVGWRDGEWIERPAGSGRELCWFPEPVGAHDCYRAELASPMLLHRTFPEAQRISARMSATRRDRLTARLPMMRPPHREGGVGALRVEVRGADASGARRALIAGVAEFVGAAAAATAAAFTDLAVTGALDPGVVVPGDAALPTADLLAAIERRGVRLQEFTGDPQ